MNPKQPGTPNPKTQAFLKDTETLQPKSSSAPQVWQAENRCGFGISGQEKNTDKNNL